MCWHKFPKWSEKKELNAVDHARGRDKHILLYSQDRICIKCNKYECRLIGADGVQVYL